MADTAATFLGRDPIKALNLAEAASHLAEAAGNQRILFEALRTQCVALSEAAEPIEAEAVITKAARIADMLDNDTLRAIAGNTLGYLQMNKGDARMATITLRKAHTINEKLGKNLDAYKNLLNLAILDFYFFKKEELALDEFDRVRQWSVNQKEYNLLNSALTNLASIAIEQGNNAKAERLLIEAIEANKITGNMSAQIYNLNQLARMNLNTRRLDKADETILGALKIADKSGLASEKTCALNTASQIQEAKGNPALALDYYKQFLRLNDSIYEAKKQMTAEFTARVIDAERQVRENEVLRRDREIQRQKMTLQRTGMIFGGILAVVLGGLLVMAINSNRKVRQLVELLRKQNHAIVGQKDQIQQLNANLEKIVEERTRQLEERTRQILDYASYNSHVVRGPLARILGLGFLLQHSGNTEETRFYLQKMAESANEMDNAIKTVNRKLELEEADYISTITGRTTIRHIPMMG